MVLSYSLTFPFHYRSVKNWSTRALRLVELHREGGCSTQAPVKYSSLVRRVADIQQMRNVLGETDFWSAVILERGLKNAPSALESALSALLGRWVLTFDNTIAISTTAELGVPGSAQSSCMSLFPKALRENDAVKDIAADMDNLVLLMCAAAAGGKAKLSGPEQMVICRLHLLDQVRCPKWHEDNITLRLVKSYLGCGTDWADPGDLLLRAGNFMRSACQHDLKVPGEELPRQFEPWREGDMSADDEDNCSTASCSDSMIVGTASGGGSVGGYFANKVLPLRCGDVLVMAGKRRAQQVPGTVPVLHRSPPTPPGYRRLLFSITIP